MKKSAEFKLVTYFQLASGNMFYVGQCTQFDYNNVRLGNQRTIFELSDAITIILPKDSSEISLTDFLIQKYSDEETGIDMVINIEHMATFGILNYDPSERLNPVIKAKPQ